ncbi:MAG TPA: MBL fold metallo-hydrolase [Methanocorpusculum sp.]|nr:MBL fold metallo-hydrolase [Methanocorpusculum sp.]
MTTEYFTREFMAKMDLYLSPLSEKELSEYVKEGEEAIKIREPQGISAEEYLGLVKGIGDYLGANTGKNFTSDYQKIPLTSNITFYSFQLPGGGNLNIFDAGKDGKMVLDTGYGCFYHDCDKMLEKVGVDGFFDTRVVICTHADADHCGASGYFSTMPLMHPTCKAILDAGTRNHGSVNNLDLLEKFYTTSINTMSRMNVPDKVIECGTEPIGMRGLFPIIEKISFAGMEFEVWESLGGHIAGQLLLFEPNLGMLFTSDAFINFATLSKERADYCSIADSMIGSVNVDSEIARTERKELTRLAVELDAELKKNGKYLLICCGHGAVSKIDENGNLVPASELIHYSAE